MKHLIIIAFIMCILFPFHAFSEENPDELYKQGKFAEAEEAYARFDMDHPKDIRYRYNRGCAAYQNSDYQGAAAAFSSVLKRSKDDDILFKSSFNLGNTAFKNGDFASAEAFYKQALTRNPEDNQAQYNLELTLREIEKQKKSENKEDSPETCPAPQDGQGQQSKNEDDKKPSEKEKSEEQSQQNENKNQDQPEQESAEKEQQDQPDANQSGKQKEHEPQDLSGELTPRNAPPGEEKGEAVQPQTQAMMDKNRAEALLDNIKEDRQRFMQFQIPEDKKDGVYSGRGW